MEKRFVKNSRREYIHDKLIVVNCNNFDKALDEFQEYSLETLKICEAKKIENIVINATKLDGMTEDWITFIKTIWYAMAEKIGIKKLAIVLPEKGIARLSTRRSSNKQITQSSILEKVFEPNMVIDAKIWIKTS